MSKSTKDWQHLHYKGKSGIIHTQYEKLANQLRYYMKDTELEPVVIKLVENNVPGEGFVKFYRFQVDDMWRAYKLMDDEWGQLLLEESYNKGGW